MNGVKLKLLVAMREDLIFLTRYILEEAGYRVLAAHDLDSAAEIIRHDPVGLAILERTLLADEGQQSMQPFDFIRECPVPLLLLGANDDSTSGPLPPTHQLVESVDWPLSPDRLI